MGSDDGYVSDSQKSITTGYVYLAIVFICILILFNVGNRDSRTERHSYRGDSPSLSIYFVDVIDMHSNNITPSYALFSLVSIYIPTLFCIVKVGVSHMPVMIQKGKAILVSIHDFII